MREMKWVVRVVLLTEPTGETSLLIDQLCFAGSILTYRIQDKFVFDILPPIGIINSKSHHWADSVAERMRFNNYNAQACPESIPAGV